MLLYRVRKQIVDYSKALQTCPTLARSIRSTRVRFGRLLVHSVLILFFKLPLWAATMASSMGLMVWQTLMTLSMDMAAHSITTENFRLPTFPGGGGARALASKAHQMTKLRGVRSGNDGSQKMARFTEHLFCTRFALWMWVPS